MLLDPRRGCRPRPLRPRLFHHPGRSRLRGSGGGERLGPRKRDRHSGLGRLRLIYQSRRPAGHRAEHANAKHDAADRHRGPVQSGRAFLGLSRRTSLDRALDRPLLLDERLGSWLLLFLSMRRRF
jgi:hypothetical protein